MHRIRYGIIGFGGFAEKAIAPAFQASANSELVAIQKRSAEEARVKAREFSIRLSFSRVEELVAHPDIDAVFIASANSLHHPQTLAAARAGKHVLVEKPMAMNVKECEEMIEACRSAGVQLMVGHMIRFSTAIRRVRELISSGALGRITFARADFFYDARLTKRNWLFDRRIAGGGPVFDVGVHCLDTLRFVLNDEVASAAGHLFPAPTATATEATASISLQFRSGIPASVYCSFEAPTRRSFLEIIGMEGMLSVADFTLGDRTTTLTLARRIDGNRVETAREEIAVPNLYIEEITHFSNCILENREPLVPGQVGLENQRVLDAIISGVIYRS
jgi:1,5-anhydro-D-fructose reductase (1,5-anhydro-D-mannitol-forming)